MPNITWEEFGKIKHMIPQDRTIICGTIGYLKKRFDGDKEVEKTVTLLKKIDRRMLRFIDYLNDLFIKCGEEENGGKMKVRIAFYIYTKKWLNAGIAYWTWFFNLRTPPASHVELGVCPEEGWRYFSSTLRGGSKGTRWISPEELFKHPERWEIIEIEVDSIEDIITRADDILGLPYDFLAILGFFTPFGTPNFKGKWCCSEADYYVLTGIWKKRISPRRFYSYIKKTYKSSIKVDI